MATQQLIFNGSRVDLPEGNKVTLNYRSNIMSGIDKITSGYSLTIKLPKTPVNDFVFKVSDLPASTNKVAYRWLSATLIVDGVQVVAGKGALISASDDSYELSLIWGEISTLKEWIDTDSTLRDLSFSNTIASLYIGHNFDNSMFTIEAGRNIGRYKYNNGIKPAFTDENENIYFPVVKVRWIFDQIIENIGEVDTRGVDITELDSLYMTFNEDLAELATITGDSSIMIFNVSDFIPEIKQVDFIKAVCTLKGWYFEQSGNILRLIGMNYLSNYRNAVDWSGKVASAITNADFTYGDFAQQNWLRYKEDEYVQTNADGIIRVNDKTLELTKDFAKLPFAATDGNKIVQYTYELESVEVINDDGIELNGVTKRTFVKTEPRILELIDDDLPYLEFTPNLFFSNIINERYNFYRSIIERPLVVELDLDLSVVDLANIIYSRPVYISQFGCYFAIIELQYSGELTKAKLIKLP